ncbi:HAD family hydrolase [Roseicyclus sp. F158]|uniref:HAD family hydrolase n=1 Tax=Tropicimonas omnivorans TaxID=3075590 RepID=A0ABU3DC88_9RHOB|nr:HAD family hydrolase [Roseicyclus sp. F158]MDT0681164.1 HAD family hydrolase [Roseicyclus sp. F158]
MPEITTVGFDADDTLWHNERFFAITQDRFAELLVDYAGREHLDERLLAAEYRNLGRYGYGIKAFLLTMVETAIEVTDAKLPASVIRQILEIGHDMLEHPIELLPHARTAVEEVAGTRRAILVTKGDLLDQERKLAQSGLGDLFAGVEIVSEKTPQVYARIFDERGDGAARSIMVGNSVKSDVLPALAAGAHAAHVPFDLKWALEHAEHPEPQPRFHELDDLGGLPALLERLDDGTRSSV